MNKILSILLIVLFSPFDCQLKPSVAELTNKLIELEKGNLKIMYFEGRELEINKIYRKIEKIATKKEIEYLAFSGSTNNKYYFSKILINSKYENLPKLYESYIKSNDSIEVKYSCVVNKFILANDLYQEIYNIPRYIREANEWKTVLDSMKYTKEKEWTEDLKYLSNYNTKWTIEEAKNMILKLDKIALQNPDTPKETIEYICMINEYNKFKIPYFTKLYFFDEKYKSKLISEYIDFCEGK